MTGLLARTSFATRHSTAKIGRNLRKSHTNFLRSAILPRILPGHLPSLVNAIAPSVKAASNQQGNALDNAIQQNVIDNVAKLRSTAPILDAAVAQQKLRVVGGIYRLRDGRVEMVA